MTHCEFPRRINSIDIVRGVSLGGIVIFNACSILLPAPRTFAPQAGLADQVGMLTLTMFFTDTFYPIYAFLFGLGLGLQMKRAGHAFVYLAARRLLSLLLLGIAHAVFVWHGDILAIYASLAVIVVIVRHARVRVLCLAGIALILAHALFIPCLGELEPEMQWGNGSYAATTQLRWTHWPLAKAASAISTPMALFAAPIALLLTYGDILGMMLLGLAAAKANVFFDLSTNFWQRVFKITFFPGLILNIFYTILYVRVDRDVSASQLLHGIGAPVLAGGYIAGLVLLVRHRRCAALVAAGRLSLSCYILQSVVLTTLSYGYGACLFNRVPFIGCLFLGIALYAYLIALSAWWLSRWKQGPLEWAWRVIYRSV